MMRLSEIVIIVLSTVLLISKCSSKKQGENVFSSIGSLISRDYEILELDSALINKDQCFDYLLALKRKEEEDGDFRPLLLIMSEPNCNGYKLKFRNDSALCSYLNGPYGGSESFSGIELTPDSIVVKYYAGMSTRWYEVHIFKFNPELNTYLFESLYSAGNNIYDEEPPEEDIMYFESERIAIDTISIDAYR